MGEPFPLKIGETIACFQSAGNREMDIDKLNIVVSGQEINGASLLIKYPGIPPGLVNLGLTFTSAARTPISVRKLNRKEQRYIGRSGVQR